MKNKIIVHIDDVQGSGKSYICSQLKNVKCIDAYDIMNKKKSEFYYKNDFPAKINKKL